MIELRDIIAAEETLENAESEFRRLNNDPREWSAFGSIDKHGKKTLNFHPGHFERREVAAGRIKGAQQQLLAVKRAFLEEVISDAAEL